LALRNWAPEVSAHAHHSDSEFGGTQSDLEHGPVPDDRNGSNTGRLNDRSADVHRLLNAISVRGPYAHAPKDRHYRCVADGRSCARGWSGVRLASRPIRTAGACASSTTAGTGLAATVAQRDVPIYLTGVGTVIAYNTVVVRSQIQGQIVSINFTEGQTANTGDLLAQIDPRPYEAQIASSRPRAIAIKPSSPMLRRI